MKHIAAPNMTGTKKIAFQRDISDVPLNLSTFLNIKNLFEYACTRILGAFSAAKDKSPLISSIILTLPTNKSVECGRVVAEITFLDTLQNAALHVRQLNRTEIVSAPILKWGGTLLDVHTMNVVLFTV